VSHKGVAPLQPELDVQPPPDPPPEPALVMQIFATQESEDEGQSVLVLQPHAPLTQALPLEFPVQSLDWEQPPVPPPPPPEELVQLPATQDSPPGQSAFEAHPTAPPPPLLGVQVFATHVSLPGQSASVLQASPLGSPPSGAA
jgi:hypothetical protein